MTEIIIRPYEEDDIPNLVDLLDTVFVNWPHVVIEGSKIDYWRWKYLENPVKPSSIMLGVDKNEIIGCHSIQYSHIIIDGKPILGGTTGDFAIHPNYRGQGLASRISVPSETKGENEGLKLIYFITSNPILIKSFTQSKTLEKRRPRFPRSIKNFARIRDIDLQLNKIPMNNPLILKAGWTALSTINKTINTLKTKKTDEVSLKPIDKFTKEYDIFWNQIKTKMNYISERDSRILNWKYCSPIVPGYNKIGAYNNQNQLEGYIIFKTTTFTPDYPIGYIVDLLSLPNKPEIQHALVSSALEYFDENQVNLINYQQVEGHPHFNILSQHGFLDGRITPHLFYHKYGGHPGLDHLKTKQPQTLHITWGDHDALPTIKPKTM